MARKRFGQLPQKRKAKIRARAKYEGLTKKQVRKQFNAKRFNAKRDSNRDKLSASNSPFGIGNTNNSQGVSAPSTNPLGIGNTKVSPFGTQTTNYSRFVSAPSVNPFGTETTKYSQFVSAPTKTETNPADNTLTGGDGDDTLTGGDGVDTLTGGDGIDDIPQMNPEDIYPDLPSFLKNNATYLSGASAGGIRRRRSRRSKLGINAMGTNQLKRNFRNMLSIGGINI